MNKILLFTETEIIAKRDHTIKRYPKLNTVLMIEGFLKAHRDMPLKMSEMKKQLPKQIMHQTLKIILEYLWHSGKIIYGPKGIQWVYSEPEHLRKMHEDTLEV
ncbi:MAG TPA: hypothetical protein VJI32_01295 [Candidatus Nanoarchaeia archaeon]|nr:hypothetical protein [Candidatus Nanoarchaeia archaeon]